jgi:ferredoxin
MLSSDKPATVAVSIPAAVADTAPATAAAGSRVVFARSSKSAVWTGSAPSLLAFAEAQGLTPEFSCRSGICSTCKCGLLGGSVTYFEEPLDPPEEGKALICISKPASAEVILDI